MKPIAFSRLVRSGSPAACLLATAIATLLALPSAQAANTSYQLTGISGNWSAATWNPATIASIAAGDFAYYADTVTASTITLDTAVTLGALAIGTAGTKTWTINATGGNAFTLDGTGINGTNNFFGNAGVAAIGSRGVGANLTINPDIVLSNTDLDMGNTNTGTMTIGGSITATTAQALNFRGSGAGVVTVNGNIGASGSNIAISNLRGTGGNVTVAGTLGSSVTSVTENSSASVLILSGANTSYAGTTTVTTGMLQGLNSGTTNVLQAFGTGGVTLNGGTLQLRANGSGSTKTIVTGNGTTGNNVTVGGSTTIDVNRSSSNTGNMFQFNNLNIGANTLSVTGGNTYGLQFAGTTSVKGAATFNPTTAPLTLGAVTIDDSLATGTTTTVILDGTAAGNQITGIISNNGTDTTKVLALTKSNSSTWTLSGANTFTGTTSVNNGTLAVSGSGTLGSAAALSMGGGTLDLGTTSQTVGAVSITAAPASGNTIQNGSLTGTSYAASNSTGTAVVSANLLANGSIGLTKSGAGTLALSGTNTYTGGTNVNAGTLSYLNLAAKPGTGTTSVAALATLGLGVSSSPGTTYFSSGDLDALFASSGPYTGNLASVSMDPTSLVGIDTTAGNFTYATTITTRGLNKLGTNALTLTGTNTYSGGTTLTAGTLRIGVANVGSVGAITSSAIGTGALSIVGGALSSDSTTARTILNPVTFTGDATLGDATNTGKLTFSAGVALGNARTLTLPATGQTAQFDGIVTGTGGFTVAGGKLILTNPNNSFSGGNGVTINGSTTLQITNVGALGPANKINMQNSSTFALDGTAGNINAAPAMGNNGPSGATFRNVAGDNTLNVGLTLMSGAGNCNISCDGGSLTWPGNFSANQSGRDVALGGNSSEASFFTSNYTVGAGYGITKSGSGTWVVSGANSFSGRTTTISAGNLIATSGSALGTSTVTLSAGAALNYAAATNASLTLGGPLTINGGGASATTIGGSIGTTTTSAQITDSAAITGVAGTSGVLVNVYGINGVTPAADTNTYTLLHSAVASTLNTAGSFTLGKVYNNTNFTVGSPAVTTTDLTIPVTSQTALTAAYWTGGLSGATNVWAVSNGSAASNWLMSDGTATALVPGSGADIFISSSNLGTPIAPVLAPTATVLGANMTIKSLTIADSVNGLGLNDDGYTLTITPASSSAGITLGTGAANSAIAERIALGAAQTWTVTDAGQTLSASNQIRGAFALTKAGAGTLVLSNFSTYTGLTTVAAGSVKLGLSNAIKSGNALTVSPTAAGTGTLDLAGFNQTIGTAATSGLTLGGGTTTSAATVTNSSGASTLTLAGTTSALTYSATNNPLGATISVATLDMNNATQTFTIGDSTTAVNDLTVSSVIQNGSLTKAGAGTMLLSGTNTYSGATTVSAGKLYVNGSNNGVGAVTVSSTATLGGTGPIAGAVTVSSGGILSPGTSAGTLNLGAGLTLAAGSIFDWENNTINALGNAGTNWDVANVTGGSTTISSTASTGTKLKLDFTNASTSFSNPFWNFTRTWDFITAGVSAAIDATNISIYIDSLLQGTTNTITDQGAFTTVATGGKLELVWTPVASTDPYGQWAQDTGLTALNNGLNQDADGDTLTNLVEYAFDTLPLDASSGPPALTYDAGAHTLSKHGSPTVRFTTVMNAVFGRRQNFEAAGLTYTVLFSADLTNWEPSTYTINSGDILASDTTIDVVQVPYPATIFGGAMVPKFFRVQVTKN